MNHYIPHLPSSIIRNSQFQVLRIRRFSILTGASSVFRKSHVQTNHRVNITNNYFKRDESIFLRY